MYINQACFLFGAVVYYKESWKGCLPHCMLSSTAVSSCCLVGFILFLERCLPHCPYFKNLMTKLIFFWSVVYFPLPLGIFLCLGVHSFVNRNSKHEPKLRHNMERRKYLMIHSRYFVYGYIASDMVKHHSDERKKPVASPWAICEWHQGIFYMLNPTQDSTYYGLCYTRCNMEICCYYFLYYYYYFYYYYKNYLLKFF